MNYSASPERWLVRACGLVCGGVSIVAAFRNGQLIGSSSFFDGLMFGSAGVAIVVMSWFLPTLAATAWQQKARVKAIAASFLWAVTAAFTLIMAIGYASHHRTEMVEGKRTTLHQVSDARRHLETATAELEAMKANSRWTSTAGCTNATAALSKGFCEQFQAKVTEVAEARTNANKQAPGSPDAQAASLSWVTGHQLSEAWISAALPILMAIVFELGAGLSFFTANASAAPVSRQTIDITPIVEPAPAVVSRPLQVVAPKATKKKPVPAALTFDGLTPPMKKLDGRTKEARRRKAMAANVAND